MCSVAFYLCLQAEMVPLKSELLSLETSEYNRKKGATVKKTYFTHSSVDCLTVPCWFLAHFSPVEFSMSEISVCLVSVHPLEH